MKILRADAKELTQLVLLKWWRILFNRRLYCTVRLASRESYGATVDDAAYKTIYSHRSKVRNVALLELWDTSNEKA